jgi:hypothetical protein
MKDDPDTRCTRLDRLAALAELARHAEPEDRARLEHTIHLVSIARQAVVVAREQRERAKQRAKRLAEEAEAGAVFQRNEQVILLTELRMMRDRTRK